MSARSEIVKEVARRTLPHFVLEKLESYLNTDKTLTLYHIEAQLLDHSSRKAELQKLYDSLLVKFEEEKDWGMVDFLRRKGACYPYELASKSDNEALAQEIPQLEIKPEGDKTKITLGSHVWYLTYCMEDNNATLGEILNTYSRYQQASQLKELGDLLSDESKPTETRILNAFNKSLEYLDI